MSSLFDPINLGSIACANRVFFAPVTRARASREGIPSSLAGEYYAQRSTAGLIISEAVGISAQGLGWTNAPGIWSDAQVKAWKPVLEAAHLKGGKMVAQLWHMGRMAHSINTGTQPIAPSAIVPPGYIHTYEGKRDYEQPHALTVDEIKAIVKDYAVAAKNAIRAGFDGVQIHAANGYLIDEFLRDSSNQRTDEYGGSPENRTRFLKEVTAAVIAAIGKDKVGVRFSPNGEIQGCVDSDPQSVFVPAAKMLQDMGVAWLELRESREKDSWIFEGTNQEPLSPKIRKVFTNPLVLNQQYTLEEAQKAVQSGAADAISWGRLFISNPDLVHRFKEGLPLAESNMETWYGVQFGAKGYTDYPEAK